MKRLAAICLGALLATSAAHSQTIDNEGYGYATADVGADEVARLRAREHEFNVKLVFTLVEGNYVSDVAVVFKDKAGNPVLVLHAPGPVVLARLPPGAYLVDATYEGRTQTRAIEARDRLSTQHLRWPSNPATDFPGPKATEQ